MPRAVRSPTQMPSSPRPVARSLSSPPWCSAPWCSAPWGSCTRAAAGCRPICAAAAPCRSRESGGCSSCLRSSRGHRATTRGRRRRRSRGATAAAAASAGSRGRL
eukprot:scaffold78196_cov45-Phaeocystis_antarctica.AAC.2